jgi:hypothetical protein
MYCVETYFIFFRTFIPNIFLCDEYLANKERVAFLSYFNQTFNVSTYFSEAFKFMNFFDIPSNCFQVITPAMYAPVLIAPL